MIGWYNPKKSSNRDTSIRSERLRFGGDLGRSLWRPTRSNASRRSGVFWNVIFAVFVVFFFMFFCVFSHQICQKKAGVLLVKVMSHGCCSRTSKGPFHSENWEIAFCSGASRQAHGAHADDHSDEHSTEHSDHEHSAAAADAEHSTEHATHAPEHEHSEEHSEDHSAEWASVHATCRNWKLGIWTTMWLAGQGCFAVRCWDCASNFPGDGALRKPPNVSAWCTQTKIRWWEP